MSNLLSADMKKSACPAEQKAVSSFKDADVSRKRTEITEPCPRLDAYICSFTSPGFISLHAHCRSTLFTRHCHTKVELYVKSSFQTV